MGCMGNENLTRQREYPDGIGAVLRWDKIGTEMERALGLDG